MVQPLSVLRKLAYFVALICGLILGITGFYPVCAHGEHISGYPMMLHATCAPVFAVCLAALAVMWAGRCCFEDGDCPVTKRLVGWLTGNKDSEEKGKCGGSDVKQKVFFWLLIALALPLILSITVSMLPFIGTHWQEMLLGLHRYVAAAFVVCGVIHAFLLVRMRGK